MINFTNALESVKDIKSIKIFLKELDLMLAQIKSDKLHNVPFIKIDKNGGWLTGAAPKFGIYKIYKNEAFFAFRISFFYQPVTKYLLNINDVVETTESLKVFLTKRIKHIEATEKKLKRLPGGPFGKIFAGDERSLPEPNNEKESDVLNSIHNHVVDNLSIPKKITNQIANVLDKKLYNDVIKKPNQKIVFRGMALSPNSVRKLLSKIPKQRTLINLKNPIKYKSLSGAGSSWTKLQGIAHNFAMDSYELGRPYIIILVAETSKNENKFFDLNEYYNQIDDQNKKEMEVIGLGEILISKIIFNFVDKDD
jgi:hypothetical protein